MRQSRDGVMGLDLSTTGAAAIAGPLGWAGDWWKLETVVEGRKLEDAKSEDERAERNTEIVDAVIALAVRKRVRVAYFEGYAFGQSNRAHHLGEIGGVVRHRLQLIGVRLVVAHMGSARKLLLGRVPTKPKGAAKQAVYTAFKTAGMWFTDGNELDQADAMTVLNFGFSELGGYCFAQHAPLQSSPARRR